MGGAPAIITLRPGVQFTTGAGASFRRLESHLGREVDVNSTYRDWDTQMGMHLAWEAWVSGRGPKPWHSRAVHPKYSIHCQGNALDSDDWTTPGFVDLAAEHGWIRTAASDPTERHHFEYQWWRDQHINEPAPAGGHSKEWDEMATKQEIADAFVDVLSNHGAGPGGRGVFDSLKFLASLVDAKGNAVIDAVPARVWVYPIAAQDGSGHVVTSGGKPVTFQAQGYLASAVAQLGAKLGTAEVDEQELAKALAPLLTANLSALSDEDVRRIATAAADEQARRLNG